ncbi:MAG: flagellar hook-length control protein FliK [Selenomonadaceae bacterium]
MKAANVMMTREMPKANSSMSASAKLKAMNKRVNVSTNVDAKTSDSFDSALDDAQNARIERNAEAKRSAARDARAISKDDAKSVKPDDKMDSKTVKDDKAVADKESDKAVAKKADQKDAADDAAKAADAKQDDVKDAAKAVEDASESGKVETPTKDGKKTEPKTKGAKSDGDAKTDTKQGTDDAAETAVTAAPTTLNAMLMAMASAEGEAAPVAEVTSETLTAGTAAQTDVQQALNGSLDALLPQDADKTAQANQNQALMDLLSGTSQSVTLTAKSVATDATSAADALTQMAAQNMLSGDGVAAEANALTEGVNVSTSAGIAATLNDASATQVIATAANVTALQGNVMTKATSADGAEAKQADASDVNLIRGLNLTVENTISMPRAESGAHQAFSDLMQQGNESGLANQTANMTMTNPNGDVITQGNQLPEEAAFDTAMVSQNASLNAPSTTNGGETQSVTGLGFTLPGMQSSTNVTSTTQAAQQAPVRDTYHVIDQIVEQARLIRSSETTEMVIHLKPEHLGELTLRVSVSAQGAVNASFHTDNPQVRGLIENSVVQLKQELEANGIKVDNVNVSSDLTGDFFAQSEGGQSQQGFQQREEARAQAMIRRAFDDDDAMSVAPVTDGTQATAPASEPTIGDDNGVDYRI